MDKKQLATIDREIAKLEAKKKKASATKSQVDKKFHILREGIEARVNALRKERLVLATVFKKGDIVKCYDPLGLYEIVEVQSRCWASDPNEYEFLAIKLTKTGNWGYCPTKRTIRPERCDKWTPDPVVEKKKK